jgi:S-disulfanyl-L-cysteine oxidoreductase SoxD
MAACTMSIRRRLAVTSAALLLGVTAVSVCSAQLPTYGLGRAPTVDEVKAWDVTIPPDGKGLPPGAGTAALGKAIYTERCASCHGPKGDDGKYSPLVGGRDTLNTDKPVRTIGSYWPNATTLWSYINRAQPFDEPGSLTHEQVYAVTAYLLHLNGIIGQDEVIDARTLPAVKMPNRDGFVPDARPDVGKTALPNKR